MLDGRWSLRAVFLPSLWILALVLPTGPTRAQGQPETPNKPVATASPSEPLAAKFSAGRAMRFLDQIAVDWTKKNHCGTCHTNYAYLMAKPAFLVHGAPDPAMAEVRGFFEDRVRHWDDPEKGAEPRWDTEVVTTASALAINDRLTTGKLHELTRKALDRMWTLQKPDGAWDWLKADLPPYEYDDYYGAVVGALGVGYAPDGYAEGDLARKGLESLRGYFRKTPPPNLHHEALLLWASTRLDGLMSAEQKAQAIRQLRAMQRPDGGWCLPSLGVWNRHDGSPNDPKAPSDGYATGLVIFVLRQAGIMATDPTLERGVAWLKKNQRESGRWFTRSLNNDKKHYIANAGTAFAVMALDACDALETRPQTGAR